MAGRTILEFYPFDFDYSASKDGKTVMKIYGTTKDGKKVLVKDYSVNPYFYARIDPEKTADAVDYAIKIKVSLEERVVKVLQVDVQKKKIAGEEATFLRIEVPQASDISAIKEEIRGMPGFIGREEIDIGYEKRYIIDKKIAPITLLRVSGELLEDIKYRVDYIIKADEIEPINEDIIENPKVIAFDIETYNPAGSPRYDSDPIIMISFSGNDGTRKLITWKRFENAPEYVEFVDSERELLEGCVQFIKKQKPDIIVGYNSDNFDMPYLHARMNKYKIRMACGTDSSEIRFSKSGIGHSAKMKGVVHIDLFTFIKNIFSPTMKTETYSLNEVAKELVGESKVDGINWENMHKLWDSGGQSVGQIAKYNMQDSDLTLKVFGRISNILFELTKLVRQPLFDVSRMTYGRCVEWYLAGRAHRFNEIIPGRPKSSTAWMKSYEGAFVLEPKPNVYENIIIYDFRSLYPSIIVSHNIGPTTINCKCCKEGHITPEINGKHYSFCKKTQGFIPHAIEDLINRRARIKEILKKVEKSDKDYKILSARSYALKTIANSMYGYLGFAKSRWYCLECAASITAWGRHHIKQVIDEAEKEGFEVIYGDTDSIMLHLREKTKKDAKEFAHRVNEKLPGVMELEFQGFYPRGIFVAKKSSAEGAKKRYALLEEDGDIIIKGFEFVRRNVSKIAKDTQMQILRAVLVDNSKEKAFGIIKDVLTKLKDGKADIEEVTIYTQLTRQIEQYESVGPHVAAAIKARSQGITFEPGQIIKYVVTKGEGSISDRAYIINDAKTKGMEYDPEYYINNQVLPAVERIFEVLGYSKDSLQGKMQTTLGGFFVK